MLINNICVVGLGLIGGSLAKAISSLNKYNVYGIDLNKDVISKAIAENTIKSFTDISECDLIIIALYPKQTIDFLQKNKNLIKQGAIVLDCGGVKEYVCESACAIAKESGFTFVGTHPMAGTEHSGFDYARGDMFINAPLIITSELPEEIKKIFLSIGFDRFVMTSPKYHDEVIAYTSQLAHVVSNAFVKSETALKHSGFSAGSFKDLTRVAWLNENMWTELFFENRDNLLNEIETLISNLNSYKTALESYDREELNKLLRDGRVRKQKVDNLGKGSDTDDNN